MEIVRARLIETSRLFLVAFFKKLYSYWIVARCSVFSLLSGRFEEVSHS
jgi:hypothetical protein